jgi:hypothetical protein
MIDVWATLVGGLVALAVGRDMLTADMMYTIPLPDKYRLLEGKEIQNKQPACQSSATDEHRRDRPTAPHPGLHAEPGTS